MATILADTSGIEPGTCRAKSLSTASAPRLTVWEGHPARNPHFRLDWTEAGSSISKKKNGCSSFYIVGVSTLEPAGLFPCFKNPEQEKPLMVGLQ
ncbi:unnamed protein product [Caretta caretta]